MGMRSWFRATARLEHFEHPVRDEKTSHNVAGGGDNGNRAKHRGQRGLMFSREQNCADHGNRIERVGQRHQRRVKERRHAPYDLEADKTCQHENVKTGNQIRLHLYLVSFWTATRGGSEKNSRTRGLITSPPCVTRVLWMISSCKLS